MAFLHFLLVDLRISTKNANQVIRYVNTGSNQNPRIQVRTFYFSAIFGVGCGYLDVYKGNLKQKNMNRLLFSNKVYQ